MTENEDKSLINTLKKIKPFKNFHILENMYLILSSILKNYLRLYY